MSSDLLQWLDNLINFPDEFLFIKYILLSIIIIILSTYSIDFFISLFLAIFKKR